MIQLDKILYTAKTHTEGGREGGTSRSSDGHLEVIISPPGLGAGTNPEQLFAAGWSTCFLSAVKLIAHQSKIALPGGVVIDAEVDLGTEKGAYGLAARLNVSLPGVEREAAQGLLEAAHKACPYSRATAGNIAVAINLIESAPVAKSTAA